MKNPLIGIVTIFYNSESVLEGFFKSLEIQTYKNFVLYAIDNDSKDNSVKLANELSSKCSFETIIIKNTKNTGIAAGNNQGILMSLHDKCDNVLLANNDIEFSERTLELLVDCFRKNVASICVPKIYYFDTHKLWYGGGDFLFGRTGMPTHYGQGCEDRGQFDEEKEISYSPTCFALFDSQIFERVGLMDENFFVYWDDTDFMRRAQRKNEKMIYCPSCIINHKVSISTGGGHSDFSVRYMLRNFVYFYLKNENIFYFIYCLIWYYVRISFNRITKSKRQKLIAYRALFEGFKLYKSIKSM